MRRGVDIADTLNLRMSYLLWNIKVCKCDKFFVEGGRSHSVCENRWDKGTR